MQLRPAGVSVAHFNNKIRKNKPCVSLFLLTGAQPPEVRMFRGQMKATCQGHSALWRNEQTA